MSKEATLLKEIISKYHPEFSTSKELRRLANKHPEYFNVCSLVEESLAAASGGKYQFIDDAHADFDDGSDSKTSTINLTNSRGDITNVVSAGGFYKDGPLRCIIYNPFNESLMYYFLPKNFWENHVNFHPTTNIGRIFYSYNHSHGEILKFERFRCENFEHLAQL